MTAHVAGLRPLALPDPARPDAGLILASLWHTRGPEQQQKVMTGVMDAWEKARLPAAYLARHCLAGSDGRTVLNFAQWTSPEAHRTFAADPRNQQTLGSAIRALYAAEPPGRYVPYRFAGRHDEAARHFTATWYDTEDDRTARALADELAERVPTAPVPSAAATSYFFIGEEGRQLLVLAGFQEEPGGAGPWFRPFRGLVRTRR
ncbi:MULTISPECIES: hypothetical protein [unclassified Streptomyces]|uniref:hypothetical protein n=1 Tax=unclassified Streptomyces TaxID=2593676 RepID=UPI0036A9FDB4